MKADLEQYATYLCDYLGVELADLQIKCRSPKIIEPKHMILTHLFNSRKTLKTTIQKIAFFFNITHGNVSHSVHKINGFIQVDKGFQEKWENFEAHARKYNYEFMDKHSL